MSEPYLNSATVSAKVRSVDSNIFVEINIADSDVPSSLSVFRLFDLRTLIQSITFKNQAPKSVYEQALRKVTVRTALIDSTLALGFITAPVVFSVNDVLNRDDPLNTTGIVSTMAEPSRVGVFFGDVIVLSGTKEDDVREEDGTFLGLTAVNTPLFRNFSIKNTSSKIIKISKVNSTGSDQFSITTSQSLPFLLFPFPDPNASIDLNVEFVSSVPDTDFYTTISIVSDKFVPADPEPLPSPYTFAVGASTSL